MEYEMYEGLQGPERIGAAALMRQPCQKDTKEGDLGHGDYKARSH